MRGLFAGEMCSARHETLRGRVERLRIGKRASRLLLWSVPRGRLLIANCLSLRRERPLIRPSGAPSPRKLRGEGSKGGWYQRV